MQPIALQREFYLKNFVLVSRIATVSYELNI